MKKRSRLLWVTTIVLTTVPMLWLTFFFMNLPWLAGDEKSLIWCTSAVKLLFRKPPDSQQFALIHTGNDLELIDRFDEFGFPVGNQAITDRNKLAHLLHIINDSPAKPKAILCDIHFVDPSPSDSMLRAELLRAPYVLLSAHLNDEGQVEKPILKDVQYGISDYVLGSAFEGVYKYTLLYNDTLPLTPLKLFTQQKHLSVQCSGPLVKIGDILLPNNFIVNYRLMQRDLEDANSGFHPIGLGELLSLPDEDIQAYVQNKVVVLGDFYNNDMHETLFEMTSGPVILVDAYLTLLGNDTRVNIYFFLLVSGVYSFLAYLAFREGDYIETFVKKKLKQEKLAAQLAGFMSYLIILCLLSTVTFYLFNIHLNVFFLAIVYYGIDRSVTFLRNRARRDA